MTYLVGVNAKGFLPDNPAIECEDLEEAKSELMSELEATAGAFGGDGEPLDNARDEVADMQPGDTVYLCGLAHWIMED